MHILIRGQCPACLHRYQHGRDNWDTFHRSPEDVQELRAALSAMHSTQCAYCESQTGGEWHVEHLWPKGEYPQRTFDWPNLFASCNRKETCGTHKDRDGKPYRPQDLIDPAVDDPDGFLLFGSDGVVQPREGLHSASFRRAQETIRVFNLNAPVLVFLREQLVNMLLNSEPGVTEFLSDLPEAERPAWVADFIANYCADGIQTPVRHLLTA